MAMYSKDEIYDILWQVDPSALDYQGWCSVGMALKLEGFSCEDWDEWSARDPGRYHPGECERKWNTFTEMASQNVTAGTIVQFAKDQGWNPEKPDGHALGWEDEIGRDYKILDKAYVQDLEIAPASKDWHPAREIIRYLETLFRPDEYVGYLMQAQQGEDGKFRPSAKGNYKRTAGELIEALKAVKNDDIGSVLGDYNPEAGAWIRFNPLDGMDVRNENVTDFRYALVESDSISVEKQHAIIRDLELPVAALIYSGGKSIHAIVRVDAPDFAEYRKRVEYLYTVCEKSGMQIDKQNRNPSRLSRLPGCTRGKNRQYIIDTNIGKKSWPEWYEYIEGLNDNLPEPQSLADIWGSVPPLKPCLIDGVLRQGHKMLLAGPSKAGKSFLQIELCIAIAEGTKWIGWQCAQGRVLYVNLELDEASCYHRFMDVYSALGIAPEHIDNIDIWNLRGRSMPMDILAPKLIRRAQKKNYIAVLIDPIYKVITGDENAADQMAKFCNQFDKIATELGVAMIYCHHHSKGAQGGKKSMDRASGSGVFARDPDALLDMIELPITDEIASRERNSAVKEALLEYIGKYMPRVAERLTEQITASGGRLREWIATTDVLTSAERQVLIGIIEQVEQSVLPEESLVSAWRIEGTLREFPSFPPVNLWFEWPVHRMDRFDSLKWASPEDDTHWYRGRGGELKPKKTPEERKGERQTTLDKAFDAVVHEDGFATLSDIAAYFGGSKKTARRYIQESGSYSIRGGYVYRKDEDDDGETEEE